MCFVLNGSLDPDLYDLYSQIHWMVFVDFISIINWILMNFHPYNQDQLLSGLFWLCAGNNFVKRKQAKEIWRMSDQSKLLDGLWPYK